MQVGRRQSMAIPHNPPVSSQAGNGCCGTPGPHLHRSETRHLPTPTRQRNVSFPFSSRRPYNHPRSSRGDSQEKRDRSTAQRCLTWRSSWVYSRCAAPIRPHGLPIVTLFSGVSDLCVAPRPPAPAPHAFSKPLRPNDSAPIVRTCGRAWWFCGFPVLPFTWR